MSSGHTRPVEMLFRTLRWISCSPLGRRDAPLQTPWAVIGWWEARRIPFNLIVGATGIATGISMFAIAWISQQTLGVPIGWPDPPFFVLVAVVAFGLAANVCYTGGWIVELIIRKTWPDRAEHIGSISFVLGICFAVVITLMPIPLAGGAALWAGVAQALGSGV